MDNSPLIDWLKERLAGELPGIKAQERMTGRALTLPGEVPGNARQGAVLALLYPINFQLHLLLIRRTADGKAHSGQISFPGGRAEEYDSSLADTALREAFEEVGLPPAEVTVLGSLTSLYIPVSNFHVHPFVGYMPARPEYTPSPAEVEDVLEVALEELLHPERITKAIVISPVDKSFIKKVPAYKLLDETIIWGATAMMISELQMLLEEYTDET